jgi:hypothetical protein
MHLQRLADALSHVPPDRCPWQATFTPEFAQRLRQEVLARTATVGYDGGLILAPAHHLQLDTPLENFWAMVQALAGRARVP